VAAKGAVEDSGAAVKAVEAGKEEAEAATEVAGKEEAGGCAVCSHRT